MRCPSLLPRTGLESTCVHPEDGLVLMLSEELLGDQRSVKKDMELVIVV